MVNENDGDRLLEAIAKTSDDSERGARANALLRAMYRGYPVTNLRVLLQSERPELVRIGTWVLSELGAAGTPLRDQLAVLLRHSDPYVRYFAIDSSLTCCTEQDGDEIAACISLVTDDHTGVRYEATDFLMRASVEQLHAAVAALTARGVVDATVSGLRWLTSEKAAQNDGIEQALRSESPVLRKFAVAAAVRRRQADPATLRYAADSSDPEVAELARRALGW